jgi:hypothetical protein
MVAMKMTYAEICKVIGDTHRENNADGKPISVKTLQKHFRYELANGAAVLRATISSKLQAALDADQPWAIQLALRNRFGWVGRDGSNTIEIEEHKTQRTLNVQFVLPDGKAQSIPVIDLEPSQPAAKPDYSRPALPAPPERRRHPLGWLE